MHVRACVVMSAIGAVSCFTGCQNDPPPPAVELVAVHRPGAQPPPAAPPPAAEQPPPAVDLSLGEGLEVRRPVRDGRLTLIPIVALPAAMAAPAESFLTLQDGLARGLVTVREVGPELEVDTLILHNRSKLRLIALAGELVIDGMQDRVLAQDRVIEPGAVVNVSVRCVEHDRETGGLTFRTGRAMAELSLRRAVAHEDQDQVWAQVDAINERLGLAPRTKTYRGAAEAQRKAAAGDRGAALARQLGTIEERGQIVGLAVAIDGRLIALDRFSSPELYRKLEPILLASYLAGTEGPPPHEGKPLGPTDVRAFVAGSRAKVTPASFVALRPRSTAERPARPAFDEWEE